MNKWYMHNPEFVLVNETHKLLYDFDIQTDHITSVRRPDLIIINKKKRTSRIIPADHRVKLKESKKEVYSRPCYGILKKNCGT